MNRAAKRHRRKLARKAALKKRGDPSGAGGGDVADELSALLEDGLQHHRAGRTRQAETLYRRILARDPDHPDGNHLLGVLAHQRGQFDLASDLIGKAIARRPDYSQAHNNLGNLLRDQGRPDEAADSYRRALAIEPGFAMAHSNLGMALRDMGRLEEAAAALNAALALRPDYAEAHSNLGLVLQDQGRLDEAMAACDKALALNPAIAETHGNRGLALQDQGRLEDAAAAIRKALELRPDNPETLNNLGAVLKNQGRLEEAMAAFRKAVEIKPDYAEAHSNLIFCMNCGGGFSQADIFAESRRWEAAHATPGTARQTGLVHDRDSERRLRIGYVSPDFKRHSVSHFLDPLIAGHDRRRFAVFCYAQVANPDPETQRFRGLADGWCSTVGMTAEAIAERVRADRIDILVDLAGHTANSRLLAFAERPAPLQIAWLGYPNTTGLAAMDYRLTDDVADPQGPGDALHSETLIRLAGGFLCFAPGVEAPAVADPPALANGPVTFGSFNNLSKVTAETVAAWARILEGAPRSRLLMKNRSLADEETRRRYRALFAGRGIAGERLEFRAWIDSPSGHLGAYDRIDIALDPFPYNGATTTCEVLWMGVPVITLRGDRHAGRVGASILTRVGLAELIADSVDAYVAMAVKLAENPDRLAETRRGLRPAMASSLLCNAAAFTSQVEAAYREMWRRWCGGG